MKGKESLIPIIRNIVVLFLLTGAVSCEKKEYDLLEPDSAGVWELYTTHDGLPGNQIMDIKLGYEGALWLAFSGNGAASYLNDNLTTYNTLNSYIINDYCTSLGPLNDGGMLIGTVDGISLRSASGQWYSYTDPEVEQLNINTIKEISDGSVWVGTEGQCLYINDGSGFYHVYEDTYANANVIEEDSDNNIWIGTDNGLLKYDGLNFSLLTISDGLPDNDVTALFQDSKKRLWIGTNGGATVAWMDNAGVHPLSLMTGNVGIYVRDIFEDRRGDIWFATWFDGLIRYDGVIPHSYKVSNGFYENDVNAIGEDSDGNLWFGLYSEGLAKYTLPLE